MSWYQRLVDKVGAILFYTLGVFILLVVVPIAGGMYVFSFPSVVVVHRSIPSPGGGISAVVYEVRGNATSSLNTQVSIAPADRSFSRDKNPSFLSIHGQHDLAVRWLSDTSVVIDLPEGEKIYRRDRNVDGVTVEYR